MKEYWTDLIHEDIITGYEISTNAKIRCKGSSLEPVSKFRTVNGFHYVDLVKKDALSSSDKPTKSFRVDHLVASAFCVIPDELKDTDITVRHIDGDTKNDMYENLEWIEYVPKYYIHTGKDGRVRIIWRTVNGSTTSKSYPKFLMEQKLGRELLPDEDVHHIDENPLNNDISNLAIIKHGEHQSHHTLYNYNEQYVKCDVCGELFLWTIDQQKRYYYDIKSGIVRYRTCSKSCQARAGRLRQLGKPVEKDDQIEYREIGNIQQ